ncbi:tRNA preQ1(34) S-adenosylmethionine ribosyltransferase-isomerase QueA [Aquicella lusitana]|uniref:S-adenosylmethionine:tRNA ribosyltransferase-isomerase n=1 Tax=Aquicella lusitana TaxID=254246 RepID=A0A370GYI0_9COXI|nr:tRNA preQ1(34) S-adenosylmethionine ribosyltransferase-isomerase QueA [Aquicella lusitana]RDI46913.1 S-adenosylmethionine:tRNA ribosyltransferase-isomerase [Aquicella lusitana]VVC73804.1 S-adenosylmethionine:tRNA ribosyltransferase-isomerase [Aquicella lusitana]
MQLNDFHFPLPTELIARYPLETRSASRLLCINTIQNDLVHREFSSLIDLIDEGDLLVFNDTKVIPARLLGQKITGGKVEVLVERVLDDQRILALVRASKAPKIGDLFIFTPDVRLEVLGRRDQFYELGYLDTTHSILEMIESIGHIPLPPYMRRMADDLDKIRYQTVYARHKGSVAAPTAGLHFDDILLQQLREKNVAMGYLTLHIGAGTFAPVRSERITEHKMHAEYLEVPAELCHQIEAAKSRGNRVIAVGTTSMRALETASQSGTIAPYHGETSIFIYPGYQFRCVDALITNLHLPCSTLLMLVCAFGGYERIMHAYREAVAQSYRFYSYGDAMWIDSPLQKHKQTNVPDFRAI